MCWELLHKRQWYTHTQLMTLLGIKRAVCNREVLHCCHQFSIIYCWLHKQVDEGNPEQALWLDIRPLLFLCVHEP